MVLSLKALAIVAPIASEEEGKDLKKMASERGLTEVHSRGNIHLFLPSNEVKTVIKTQ